MPRNMGQQYVLPHLKRLGLLLKPSCVANQGVCAIYETNPEIGSYFTFGNVHVFSLIIKILTSVSLME